MLILYNFTAKNVAVVSSDWLLVVFEDYIAICNWFNASLDLAFCFCLLLKEYWLKAWNSFSITFVVYEHILQNIL